MALRIELIAVRAVEVLFFVGLAGCAVTVLLSWISVWHGSLHDKN